MNNWTWKKPISISKGNEEKCEQMFMEKAKAESVLIFWNTEGADWRKIPVWRIGESEDMVESVARTRDKNTFSQIKRFR